jgi:translation initiation factor IF-1
LGEKSYVIYGNRSDYSARILSRPSYFENKNRKIGEKNMTEKKNRREKKNPREAKVTFEGLVTEALPNGMFRVRLENDTIILGYISGKIRSSSIRILMGDRVKIEVSRYDSSKGRIIYRLPHKDSKRIEDSKDIEDLKDSEDSKD